MTHPYEDLPHLTRCRDWVIAFTPYRGRNPLLKIFLKRFCGHVWAFTEVSSNTLIVDPFNGGYFTAVTKHYPGGSGVGVTPAVLTAALIRTNGADIKLLRFKTSLPKSSIHPANFNLNCVSMVKMLLGVRTWAMTPHQLYKYLLKNGATQLQGHALESFLECDKLRRAEQFKKGA